MPHTICDHCHKNVATVRVIEIPPQGHWGASPAGQGPAKAVEQNLCEICAQAKDLPHAPVFSFGDIWKLLRASGSQAPPRAGQVCPACGMTLQELRARGRIGCARDYEVFADEILEILERVHGATEHVGRIPGMDPGELDRLRAITNLRRDLDAAIQKEAYESAARIRDELAALEGSR